jgi:hypothetical protein
MAKQVYTFSGKVEWLRRQAKTWPDGSTNYSVSFFPASADERKAMKATGIKNVIKVAEKGDLEGQMFYSLKSDEPFVVMRPDGTVFDGYVGNGSEVTIRLEVETFESKYGPNARSKVLGIVLNKLVEFVPEEKPAADAGLPA